MEKKLPAKWEIRHDLEPAGFTCKQASKKLKLNHLPSGENLSRKKDMICS